MKSSRVGITRFSNNKKPSAIADCEARAKGKNLKKELKPEKHADSIHEGLNDEIGLEKTPTEKYNTNSAEAQGLRAKFVFGFGRATGASEVGLRVAHGR